MIIKRASSLKGEVTIPGDKSISHRGIMLGSLAEGTTEVSNFLQGADCLSTIECFRKMGIAIENKGSIVTIKGNGLRGLRKPNTTLDVGNSGTTTRLISGILAPQNFDVILNGDASIQKRPMGRIMKPLSMMGADITSLNGNDCAPIKIQGKKLTGIHYESPVASAQIKSCILLAGLYADGETAVTEPYVSRNHTELLFQYFGIDIKTSGTTSVVKPIEKITGQKVIVPGDISSAAYFIAAGLLVPNSQIVIKNVGINSTRDGIIKVCQDMGADLHLENIQSISGEPTADIIVSTSNLNGLTIGGSLIPTLIDEIPIIAVLACFAKGDTIIKDAAELKVKESNRIDVMVQNLTAMGAHVEATDDGMIIHGGKPLHGAVIDSKLDHRIAMSFTIAGLVSDGETTIKNAHCVDISYPTFYTDLESLKQH